MIKRIFMVAALMCVVAAPLCAQNTTTFGNIVGPGTPCGSANCVYYQLPPATPWVTVTVTGTWSGTIETATTSAPNANYSNLDTLAWTPLASNTVNGTWSASTSGATYLRVRATNWASGSAHVVMTAVQSQAPVVNPVFNGQTTATGYAAAAGGSAATCWTTSGGVGACNGAGAGGSVNQVQVNNGAGTLAGTPATIDSSGNVLTPGAVAAGNYAAGADAGVFGQTLQTNGKASFYRPSAIFSLPGVNHFVDSITFKLGANSAALSYAGRLDTLFGPGGSMYAVSGSWAADSDWQIYSYLNPHLTGNIRNQGLWGMNDYTDDFNSGGNHDQGRQDNFTHTLRSQGAWATIPAEFKLSGVNYTAAGCTTHGTVAVSNYGAYLKTVALESNDAYIDCPTLQTGTSSMYLNWLASTSGTTSATVSIDGTTVDTINNFGFGGQDLGTSNNPAIEVPLASRYALTGSGSHTFRVACAGTCATQGGIVGGIYLGGITANGTPSSGQTCNLAFSNGGTATVPIDTDGFLLPTRFSSDKAITITAAGSSLAGAIPTTATVTTGSAASCTGTANVLLWTDGPFVFAWEGSPSPITGVNLGNQTVNPPNMYFGGAIRTMQSFVFTGGTGAQSNPYADTFNTLIKNVANELHADGAYAIWVDVRQREGTDYATLDSDMVGAALPNGVTTCNSNSPGKHPSGCNWTDPVTGALIPVGGHEHLFESFAEAMQPNVGTAMISKYAIDRVDNTTKLLQCNDGSAFVSSGGNYTVPDPSACVPGHDYTIYNFGASDVTLVDPTGNSFSQFTPLWVLGYSSITLHNYNGTIWYYNSQTDTRRLVSLQNSSAGSCDYDNEVFLSSGTVAESFTLPSSAVVASAAKRRCRIVNMNTSGLTITGGGVNGIPSVLPPNNTLDVEMTVSSSTPVWHATNQGVLGGSITVASGTYGDSSHVNVIHVNSAGQVDTITPTAVTATVAPVYTFDNCTAANCAGLHANQTAQSMVASVPGSNGAVYTFKGELDQASLGTSCTAGAIVTLQLTYTNLIRNASVTTTVQMQIGGTTTTQVNNLTSVASGNLPIYRFNYLFTAKSGTAITWNTTGYTNTGCSGGDWTYTLVPNLVQEDVMQ